MIAKTSKKPETRCAVPTCERSILASRGLCNSCYQSALKLVRENRTTWKQLESLGLAKTHESKATINPLRLEFERLTQCAKKKGKVSC